jgi:ABC-2 type transport system permease protein
MRVLDLAQKDLIQIVRDWKSALFLLIMPILFTFFFGFVFGPIFNPKSEGDPRLPVGVVNQDAQGSLSAHLVDLIDSSDAIRPLALNEVDRAEVARRVEQGELAAAVIIPAGYSQRVLSAEDSGLAVVTDQTTAAGQTAVSALKTVTDRLMGAVEAAQISAESYAGQAGFDSPAARQQLVQEALDQAIAAWREPPLRVEVQEARGATQAGEDLTSTNPFVQSSPGMIVQFAIFGLTTSAMVLVLERQSRALQRLLTTPIRPAQVIAGHVLAMFFVVFVQQAILVGLGQFAFGVDYLRAPLATLLVMVTLALWTASLGLLIGALAKREEQVITLSMIAMFVFSALGGAWFPLEVTGQAFATIGHLMPTAWAMDGFQNIVVRGQGLASVLLPTGALLAYAVIFFGLAVWRFRFE